MYIPEFSIPLNREDLCQAGEDGQYFVRYFYSLKELQERLEDAKNASLDEGPSFIVDHFPTFYSLLQDFKQTTELNRQKALTIISKSLVDLIGKLNVVFDDIKNIEPELKNDMRNITKMICYVLIELMNLFQDKYIDNNNIILDPKVKKKQKAMDCGTWIEDKLKILNNLYLLLQLQLKMLWDPPVVDEEFVNLIANFCYKCLEDVNISATTMKSVRDTIFQIIGTLIKTYLHGLSFCVKVVQLLKSYEHVVNPLAKGVVQLVQECKCTNIVKEIVREISETDGDQLVADSSGTRSLNLFLVQLAESIPDTIIPAIDLLIHHLAGDSYTMRICVVEVLGEIILTTLTKENLEEDLKKMRDEFLDCLEDHIHDINAFVRSKVLQIWQKLCGSNCIPISRLNHLLELAIARLNDKSTNVKKQAIHLIKDLLERNPYSSQLNAEEIKIQLKEEVEKIDLLRKTYKVDIRDANLEWKNIEPKLEEIERLRIKRETNESGVDDRDLNIEEKICEISDCLIEGKYEDAVQELASLKDKCNTLLNLESEDVSLITLLRTIFYQKINAALVNLPVEVQEKLNKHKVTVEYLENALKFAELIDQALPVILTLLDSTVMSDVLESIHFFTAAYLFGFQQALEGVRKILYLMYSKEDAIKTVVSEAYQNIYFDKNTKGRQHSLTTMKNLGDLVLKLNESQLNALELVVKKWQESGLIDNNFVQVMFERFSRKIVNTSEENSWAALVLIRMVGSQEPCIIKNNISVILSQSISNAGNQNLLIAKEACRALSKLVPERQHGKTADETFRYWLNHEIFVMLNVFLRDSLWRTKDLYYIPMAEEAINLVFQLCDQPDSFCERLISEIYERIVNGEDPLKSRKGSTCKLLSQNERFDELIKEENVEPKMEDEEIEDVSAKDIIILTRFISVLGQIAANYILYLEGPVLNELKRRNQVDYERKMRKLQENPNKSLKNKKNRESVTGLNKSEPDIGEDLDFNRVAADDMDAEEMKKITEHEMVTGSGYFAKFTPLILTICKNPGKYNNTSLQNAAVLTLSKFMLVSSVFCEENLQLLVTICEKSQSPLRRKNAIIALGALQYRFPNSLEPWTQHMYGILRDPDPDVRISAVLVLTDLIVNEMIKVRSNISDLALCIVDKDPDIAKNEVEGAIQILGRIDFNIMRFFSETVRHFFREYSLKGNSLFNVLPCLISDLIRPNSNLTEDEFKTIMKFILALFTKDKQSEYLIDKLFQYFESATTERQWKDISFCLSLLNYNDKGLKKILDNLRYFGNKLYISDIYEAFSTIVTNAAKNPQKDKTLLKEIQDLIKECRDKSCQDKNVTLSIQKNTNLSSCGKLSASRRVVVSGYSNKESKARKQLIKVKEVKEKDDLDDDDDDDDAFLSDTSIKKIRKNRTGNKKTAALQENVFSDDSENGECPKKLTKNVRNRSQAKKSKVKSKCTDDTSEEEEKQERVLRSNRKRK